MAIYRSRPFEVDAEQYRKGHTVRGVQVDEEGNASCVTMHGQKTDVVDGDYIIAEPTPGFFYPCKPQVFETKYERIG